METIKYRLCNGSEVELTVTIEVAMELSKEKKFNKHVQNEYERYGDDRSIYDKATEHHRNLRCESIESDSLDNLFVEGIFKTMLEKHNRIHIERFVLHYICGYSLTEIAEMQYKNIRAIWQSVELIKNSFLDCYFVE